MIISASRRTDIPGFFGDWFINRLKDGYLLIRNPMNTKQVSRIAISPDRVECLVFWTKNPSESFIDSLKIIDDFGFPYYFLFTITPYGNGIEKNLPDKKIVINKFKKISQTIGKDKIIWRYDPIFINNYYNAEYHKKSFDNLLENLKDHTEKCIISFVDKYPRISKRLDSNQIFELSLEKKIAISTSFSESIKNTNLTIETCCEDIDLSGLNIKHGHCIDGNLINKITDNKYIFTKDKVQRDLCGCIESVDIGTYNTCRNNCLYCYANWQNSININKYDPQSPILCSKLTNDDKITDRVLKRCEIESPSLFNE